MTSAYVIHENPAWLPPFAQAFDAVGLRWQEWRLDQGAFDLSATPPDGVFYSRMSASAHTRGHRHAPDLAATVLAWLERHGRRVVNGTRALDLELSKVRQAAALEAAGLATPRTVAVVGRGAVLAAARSHFGAGPVILKPNRGGKGLGVQLFRSVEALGDHVASDAYDPPVDGVHLLQEYVETAAPFITRAEFVGGRFLYAVRVDTSDGGFELCPAEACAVDAAFCPTGEDAVAAPRFQLVEAIDDTLRERYERFLAANDIAIAGIEFMEDRSGRLLTYDVNTNTNYNPEAETRAGRDKAGPTAVAQFLQAELSHSAYASRREAA